MLESRGHRSNAGKRALDSNINGKVDWLLCNRYNNTLFELWLRTAFTYAYYMPFTILTWTEHYYQGAVCQTYLRR